MTTTKVLTNDLIAMEKQNPIKKAGYAYNRVGDPEQRYELTLSGMRISGPASWNISQTQTRESCDNLGTPLLRVCAETRA